MRAIRIFNRKSRSDDKEDDIYVGRVSVVSDSDKDIYTGNTRTTDLLTRLQNTSSLVEAIQLVVDETPDGKMAQNIYLRLANQGFNVTWHKNNTGRVVRKYDTEFREFTRKMGANNSMGVDGLVDQLHSSSLIRGGMAVEAVVNDRADDIQEIVVIDPATISEFKWNDELQRYEIYQQQTGGQSTDLMTGNFYWVPHQPKPGRPDGTLQFAPAVMATIYYLQLLEDSTNVLGRIAFPRYDFSIDRKTFLESIINRTPENIRKQIETLFGEIKSAATQLKYDNDFVHFDEVKVGVIGGGVNGAGIDVRAWFEVLDPLIINAFQLTPVLMGRLSSGSYSLGSVEFKIVTDTVDSMRRGSKRILESIFKLWARVKGYDIYPVIEYNPIDWEKELDKINSELKNLELYRRYEEYGYIDKDRAAMNTVGSESASGESDKGLYVYLAHDFREAPGADSATENNDSDENTAEKEENGKNENEQP